MLALVFAKVQSLTDTRVGGGGKMSVEQARVQPRATGKDRYNLKDSSRLGAAQTSGAAQTCAVQTRSWRVRCWNVQMGNGIAAVAASATGGDTGR